MLWQDIVRGKPEGQILISLAPFYACLIIPSSVIILNIRWLFPTIVKRLELSDFFTVFIFKGYVIFYYWKDKIPLTTTWLHTHFHCRGNNLKAQEHRSKNLLEVKSCADPAEGIQGTALVNQEMPQVWIVSVLTECQILWPLSIRQSRTAATKLVCAYLQCCSKMTDEKSIFRMPCEFSDDWAYCHTGSGKKNLEKTENAPFSVLSEQLECPCLSGRKQKQWYIFWGKKPAPASDRRIIYSSVTFLTVSAWERPREQCTG